jgi:hypothetical protein
VQGVRDEGHFVVADADAATLVAQAECERRGWWWGGPVTVRRRGGGRCIRRRDAWIVRTNAGAKGANATLVIDAQSGEIVQAFYVPN